jgi:hypothetical protein
VRSTTIAGSASVLAAAAAVAAVPENLAVALAFAAVAAVLAIGVAIVLLPPRLREMVDARRTRGELVESPLDRLEQLPVGLTGRRYLNWRVEPTAGAGHPGEADSPDPEATAAMIRSMLGRRLVLLRRPDDKVEH